MDRKNIKSSSELRAEYKSVLYSRKKGNSVYTNPLDDDRLSTINLDNRNYSDDESNEPSSYTLNRSETESNILNKKIYSSKNLMFDREEKYSERTYKLGNFLTSKNKNNFNNKDQGYHLMEFSLPEGGISMESVLKTDRKFADIFNCSFCLALAWEPKMCKVCQNVLCNECVTKIKKNITAKCPMRCSNSSLKVENLGRALTNVLNLIKIKCFLGCGNYVQYSEIEHHYEICPNALYGCDNEGCEFKGNITKIKAHVTDCPFDVLECKFCKQKIRKKEYNNHVDNLCEEAIVECVYCKEKMKRKIYKDSHYDPKNRNPECLAKQVETLNNDVSNYKNLYNKYKNLYERSKK